MFCFRVTFPETVKWMSLEFDPQCATAQPEDCLQLYVPTISDTIQKSTTINKTTHSEEPDPPALPYWPVLHKFSGW